MACQHRQHGVLRTLRKKGESCETRDACGAEVEIATLLYRIEVLTRRRISIVVKGAPRGLMSEMNMYLVYPYLARVYTMP